MDRLVAKARSRSRSKSQARAQARARSRSQSHTRSHRPDGVIEADTDADAEVELQLTSSHDSAVFATQPLYAGPLSTARAAACALLWRTAGINTGFGTSPDMHSSGTSAPYVPQLVLAEWLCVWAACEPNTVTVDGLRDSHLRRKLALFDGTLPVVATAWSGRTAVANAAESGAKAAAVFWCPLALLQYLAGWYGSVAPMFCTQPALCHAFRRAVRALVPAVQLARPCEALWGLRDAGAVLPPLAFVAAVNAVFGGDTAGQHRVGVVACSPGPGVLTLTHTGPTAPPQCVPCAHDVAMGSKHGGSSGGSGGSAARYYCPGSAFAGTMAAVDGLTSGDTVAVVPFFDPSGEEAAVPVLSTAGRLPPMLAHVLVNSADTMATALADTLAHGESAAKGAVQALCAAASGLWYLHSDAAMEAVQARCRQGRQGRQDCQDPSDGNPLLTSLVMSIRPGQSVPNLALPLAGVAAHREAIVLYLNPSEFTCVATAIAPLQQLSSEYELVAVAAPDSVIGPGGLPTLYLLRSGRSVGGVTAPVTVPVAVLVPGFSDGGDGGDGTDGEDVPDGGPYVYRVTAPTKHDLQMLNGLPDAPPNAPPAAVFSPSLLAPVAWTLSFGREDLLAIALSGADAIAAFGSLAQLHAGSLHGMCSQASTASVQAAVDALQRCNVKPPKKSRHSAASREASAAAVAALCSMLPAGIAVQLVVQFQHLQTAHVLLQDLDKAVFVCVAEDKESGEVFMGPATESSSSSASSPAPHMVFTHKLQVEVGKVTPLRTPTTRRWDQVAAWSEAAPLRGVAIGAVTLAVASALGSEHVHESLTVIADLASAQVNDHALNEAALCSAAKLHAYVSNF
jgi:hypothetical protein